jgi:hypothetical protein
VQKSANVWLSTHGLPDVAVVIVNGKKPASVNCGNQYDSSGKLRFNWLKNARGLKKSGHADSLWSYFNNLQARKQHVHELTLPCVCGAGL